MTESKTLHRVIQKCLVCGTEKQPLEDGIIVKCALCGESFEAYETCENHHFVCHMCRQKSAREKIIAHCLKSKLINPYALLFELMKLPETTMHGPEHHLLVPATLLTAFCNVKGRDDLANLLLEANTRSMQVPGGACGHWGICGAAIGAGIFSSIVLASSPFAEGEWQSCGQLTARCADAISCQGGPRCCKRDSFTALKEAIVYCNAQLDTDFDTPDPIQCQFFINNTECKGKACPFFPKPKEQCP